MNIEEKSFDKAIKTAGKHLVHMHVCENDRGAPGTGLIDWNIVAQALKDVKIRASRRLNRSRRNAKPSRRRQQMAASGEVAG